MSQSEIDSRCDTALHMQIVHLEKQNRLQAYRIKELEQAIHDHKRMVEAGRRYNIFLHDEAHKDLWELVSDELHLSGKLD